MTKRLRIGLDFDDTLMPTREAMVELLNAAHGTSIDVNACTEFFFTQRWNYTRPMFTEFFTRHEATIHPRAPFEGVLETLKAWAEAADFYVITGRPECWKNSAVQWLERHGISVRDVLCTEGGPGKAAGVKAHGISLFIDDRPDFVAEIAQAGVPVLLLDRPYNQGFAHPMVARVKDWHEIRTLVAERGYLETSPVDKSDSYTTSF